MALSKTGAATYNIDNVFASALVNVDQLSDFDISNSHVIYILKSEIRCLLFITKIRLSIQTSKIISHDYRNFSN